MARPLARIRFIAAGVIIVGVLAADLPAGAEPGFGSPHAIPTPHVTGPIPIFGYSGLACPDAATCTTAGQIEVISSPPMAPPPAAATSESGGTWSAPSTIPMPSGAARTSTYWPGLHGLACPAVGRCQVVGGFATTSSGASAPLIATLVAGVWSSVRAPMPTGAATGPKATGVLTSIQCPSVGDCVASGSYLGADGKQMAFVDQETSGVWAAGSELPAVPGSSASTYLETSSLFCTDLVDCTLLASTSATDRKPATYLWTETGGTWTVPAEITAPSTNFVGNSMACPSSTTCLVVGEQQVKGFLDERPAYVVEKSGTWSPVTGLPMPRLYPQAMSGSLSRITCPSATLCVAVGSWFAFAKDGYTITGGVATWSNDRWSSVGYLRTPRSAGSLADESVITGLACQSTTSCLGIGTRIWLSRRSFGFHSAAYATTVRPVRAVVAPGSPIEVGTIGIRDGLIATWQPPIDDGGASVRSFTAVLEPGGHSCTTSGDRCRFTGLANGRRFQLHVTDATSHGSSALARDNDAVSGLHPTRPTRVRILQSHGHLDVTWLSAKAPPGEPVRDYVVSLRGPHRWQRRLTTRRHSCRFVVERAGIYTVTIVAVDASGSSAPSRAAHARVRRRVR